MRLDTEGSTFRLSELLGQQAFTPDGRTLGRVVDLTVELDSVHPAVRRLALGTGRHVTHLVPHAALAGAEAFVLASSVDASDLPRQVAGRTPALHDLEVLLARDVLDTQVVDLHGHRLRRVSDVVLVTHPGGGTEVVGVDVGLGALLQRMGLRRAGARISPVVIDWEDLHLTSSRGHLAQLSTKTSGLRRLDAVGMAELVARLRTDQAAEVLGAIDPTTSATAFSVSHRNHQRRLFRLLGAEGLASMTEAGPPELRRRADEVIGAPARRRFLRTSGWRLDRPHRDPSRSPKARP